MHKYEATIMIKEGVTPQMHWSGSLDENGPMHFRAYFEADYQYQIETAIRKLEIAKATLPKAPCPLPRSKSIVPVA